MWFISSTWNSIGWAENIISTIIDGVRSRIRIADRGHGLQQLVNVRFVNAPHPVAPVVGVCVDDIGGDIASEVLDDASVAGSVPEVRRKKVPEVVWRDVLVGVCALPVPASLRGTLGDDCPHHRRRRPLAPLAGRTEDGR